jgi:DNA helicase HerA-like ATPase
MPQELPPDPHAALMLNRVVRMVKVGRNYGIGNVIITQEPQAVSKRALSQVNCLFMGYMQGDKPRKAVRDWISDRARSSADST